MRTKKNTKNPPPKKQEKKQQSAEEYLNTKASEFFVVVCVCLEDQQHHPNQPNEKKKSFFENALFRTTREIKHGMQSIARPCGVRVASSRATSSHSPSRRNAVMPRMDKYTPKASALSAPSARESRAIRGSESFKRDILKREKASRRSLKTKATGARYDFGSALFGFCRR